METILTSHTASITELKTNPMVVANSGFGEPVAILNRNNVAFYCVPVEMFDRILDKVDDLYLLEKCREVENEESIAVDLSELKRDIP